MQDVTSQFREFIRLDRKNRSSGLTPLELDRWVLLKRKLARQFAPDVDEQHADARASVRVPTRLRVDFTSVDALRGQLMTNLSRGGLFVASKQLLAVGTRVKLLIQIDSQGQQLEVPAEVVSHDVGPHFEPEARGMGLRFLEVDAETERQLDELYEHSLRRAASAREK